MKLIHTIFILGLPAFAGCDAKKPSKIERSSEVTVDDVLWATEWNIYKWRIGDLTKVRLSRIQVVGVGPDGKIAKEGPAIGYDAVLDPDMEVAIALKKVEDDVMVKLRGEGFVSSTIEGVFTGDFWSFGPRRDVHENLLVVATNSSLSASSSKSDLAQNCNKLCLKLWPYTQKDAEKAAP